MKLKAAIFRTILRGTASGVHFRGLYPLHEVECPTYFRTIPHPGYGRISLTMNCTNDFRGHFEGILHYWERCRDRKSAAATI